MNIIRGKTYPPSRIVIYGPPGVGKSTFAASSPAPLALSYERGLEEIGCDRIAGEDDWPSSLKLVREACTMKGDYRTIIIDTIDRLEDQATAEVCRIGVKGKSLPDLSAFGYGDGYEALAARWRELLAILELASAHGREVILVAHVQSKTIDDPTMSGTYSKFLPQLQKRCWGATHRWADAVLFAQYEQGMVEKKAVMTGLRQLHTQAGTGYEAKNRWGLAPVLPLSWAAFNKAREAMQRGAEEVRASIRAMAPDELKEKAEGFIKDAGDDVARLVAVENALKEKVSK